MYDAMISGINNLGGVATAINDSKKLDSELKLRASQLKESEQNQSINAQTLAKNNETAAQALAKKQLLASIEDSGALLPKAQDGTKTENGTAVDFQAVKSSREFDQAAKAWNTFHQDDPKFTPVSGEMLRKQQDAQALERNRADNNQIQTDQMASETHKSKLENDKAMREGGRFAPVALAGGNLGVINTRTGNVRDSGEDVDPKIGSNKIIAKAGETLIPNMEPIEGVQITNESVKKVKDSFAAYQSFKNQLDEYRTLVSNQGSELVGEKADKADALVTDLGMKLKALQDLGVLNGRDWELMMKQTPGTTGFGASIKGKAYAMAGQDAFGPRLDVLSNSMADKFKVFAETNGFRIANKNPAVGNNPVTTPTASSSKFKILSVEH
jgi:hypothetical protein